jgi:hypothetical protein
MLLDLRSLLEAEGAEEFTGAHAATVAPAASAGVAVLQLAGSATGSGIPTTSAALGTTSAFDGIHTGTGAPGTAAGTGQVVPGVTVFPGVSGGFRPREEITAEGIAVSALATADASGALAFAADALHRAALAAAGAQATQEGAGAASGSGTHGAVEGLAEQGFRARRISAGRGRPSVAAALAQVRIAGAAAIVAAPATAGASGAQRTNGLTTSSAPLAAATSHAGVRANGLATQAAPPAAAAAEARIRYPRRFGAAAAPAPPATARAAGASIQVVTGTAGMRAEPAGALSVARRRFRPDPVALQLLGIIEETDLRRAS